MPLTTAQLQATLQQALSDNIAALAALSVAPRPDGTVDGTSNQWTALRKSLLEEQELILFRIQQVEGPWESISYPQSQG
jgi:hypothetical protein